MKFTDVNVMVPVALAVLLVVRRLGRDRRRERAARRWIRQELHRARQDQARRSR